MEKTYAAFYIPKNTKAKRTIRKSLTAKIKQKLSKVIKNSVIKSKVSDLNSIAKFMVNKTNSAFKIKYAISGLSDLLSNSKILNQTKRDKFFDVFAPVLNKVSNSLGFENLSQLKDCLASQNDLNKADFLTLLTDCVLLDLQEGNVDYSGYGTEIPIDVVESCSYMYKENIAEHPFQNISDRDIWLSDLGLVKINFVGHIKNAKGELVVTNSYMQRLGECMKNKQPVVLRIGKDVYENCLIENMSPVITNIYELKLVMTLKYSYSGNNLQNSIFGGKVLNPNSSGNNAYLLSNQIYAGIIS